MRTFSKQSIINFGLLALLSLGAASCVQKASGVQPLANQNANAHTGSEHTPPPTHPYTVRFWRDYSKSLDEEALAKIANELADAILRHKEQIEGIEVVRFADGPKSVWAEMPVKFHLGAAPEIPEFKPDLDNAPPDAKLFKDAMKKYIASERRKYEENRALLLSAYEAHVEAQLKKFTDHLRQGPADAAPCTQFTSLAERMRIEDLSHSVLLTDGWADCPDEKDRVPAGVALHGKLVIIQLTRHMDSQANDEEFLQRNAFLHKLFPTSEVMPASMPEQAIESIFR